MNQPLSEYELMREKNLKERLKLLENLNLTEAASDFNRSVQVRTPEAKKPRLSKSTPRIKSEPVRRSSRLILKESTASIEKNDIKDEPAIFGSIVKERPEKVIDDKDYDYVKVEETCEHTDYYISHENAYKGNFSDECAAEMKNLWHDLSASNVNAPFKRWDSEYKSLVSQMSKLRMKYRIKVGDFHSRAYTAVFHPSSSKVFLLVGNNVGCVWMADLTGLESSSKFTAFNFRAHKTYTPVPSIKIAAEEPSAAYSCAYDGCVKKLDFNTFTFSTLFEWPDDRQNRCKSMDMQSKDTLLVARFEAPFALIDVRTCQNELSAASGRHYEKGVHCVNVHPQQRQYFVTSAVTGSVKLWDIRKLKQPLTTMQHDRSVRSAYFSPQTGDAVLTTCSDNTLNVWRPEIDGYVTGDYLRSTRIPHNNQTGRWLTPFSAVWHPANESFFICGSLNSNRRIDIFDRMGQCVVGLTDLNLVCSITGFHPLYNMAVGLNSSTYLHVWLPHA